MTKHTRRVTQKNNTNMTRLNRTILNTQDEQKQHTKQTQYKHKHKTNNTIRTPHY